MKVDGVGVSSRVRRQVLPFLVAGCLTTAGAAGAQVAKQGHDVLSSLAFRSERLAASEPVESLDANPSLVSPGLQNGWAAFQIGRKAQWHAAVDKRTALLASADGGGIAWIPGRGNQLTLGDLGPALQGRNTVDLAAVEGIARRFLPQVAGLLGVQPSSLLLNLARSGQPAAHVWFVDFDVLYDGLPVEGARVVFRVNNGNLVQFGTENLPAPGLKPPAIVVTRSQALQIVSDFVGGFTTADSFSDSGSLHLIPVLAGDPRFADGFELGKGRGLAKVWQLAFRREGVTGTWRARVDAATGELLELVDTNDYATAQVTGGVYMVSPAVAPEVVRPMPLADVSSGGFVNSAGLYNYTSGTVTSTLSGQYVDIFDTCGAISQASDASGNIAFGTSSGTDCTTPGHGGAGNTHASRTQFYHVNRTKEVGRGWLPSNTWLSQQLQVNVNLNQTCNAYWNGSSLNFFKSGGGCRNSGEIAGVSLHEYGHGLDQNDGNGASPDHGTGETYGDWTAALALHDSCIGTGFFLSGTCMGYGDACSSCSGVRDIDWAKHASGVPHTVSNFTQVRCPSTSSYFGPCGKEGHCESYISSEALWDFVNRDLPSPGTGAAWTTVDRLWYLSRSTATAAFSCTTGSTYTSNGCNIGSLWKTLRAVDDDDGDLTNGTPHGGALFAAFNRHGIACTTDPGAGTTFAGCAAPAAPGMTLSLGDNSMGVAVSGTGVFDIYRNEVGCNAGFIKIANNVAAGTFTDTGVANGATYYYQAIAHPSGNEACASAPASCQSAVPTSTPPDFSVSCSPSSLTVQQGGNTTSTCTVTSLNGFASAVSLSCSGLPSGVSCAFSPSSVTPPANGTVTSTLTVSATSSAATGTTGFTVAGTGTGLTRTSSLSLTVNPPPSPDFKVSCSPNAMTVGQGGAFTTTCDITSLNGFSSAVSLACTGLPSGASCSFLPGSVTPPANGKTSTTLTVSAASTTALGLDGFHVRGTSGSLVRSDQIDLTVAELVFFDDFETDQGWTTNPGGTDTATGGLWERGIPSATRWQLSDTPTGVYDLVTGASGTTAGDNDVDGGVTKVRSAAITLPASGTITLSFAYYLAYKDGTSDDSFRVKVLLGGSTVQVFADIASGTQDPQWTTVTADLSAYAGQTIRIRFEATDGGVDNNIEAAVDDVQITRQ